MRFDDSGWLFPRSSLNTEAKHNMSEEDVMSLFRLSKEERAWQSSVQEGADRYSRDGTSSNSFFSDFILMQNARGAMQSYPFGDYLNYATTRHFYRGENQRFPTSMPSLNRSLSGLSARDQEICRAVSNLRINQFADFIFQFHIVPYWMAKVSDVNFKAIAQHYGFHTYLLDLTNDVLTALFFATCYYDRIEGHYKPLTQERIQASYASHFGVIYHAPYWLVAWQSPACGSSWFLDMEEKIRSDSLNIEIDSGDYDGYAFQIGFQPLMRCHYQSGYVLPMKTKEPLQNDFRFERLIFRQSEKLSNYVYEAMDCGKKVFPQEGISLAEETTEKIRHSLQFTKEEIEAVYNSEVDQLIFADFQVFLEALRDTTLYEQPIEVVKDRVTFELEAATMERINEQYDNTDIGEMVGGQIFMKPEQKKRRKEEEIRIYGREIE